MQFIEKQDSCQKGIEKDHIHYYFYQTSTCNTKIPHNTAALNRLHNKA